MVNPRQTITIQGEGVELLITPSMYRAALTRGMDLTLADGADTAEVWDMYVKHVYLAYRNAMEVAAFDGKPAPLRTYDLADFEAWAAGEGKARFVELMGVIVYLRTGKTIEELTAEAQSKKKPKSSAMFRSWLRGSRSGTGS
jgi:hypothetical protein